jgi:hypothetical protein
MQMVIWSPNGSQFDDRLVYLTYSAFNCKKVAQRLRIPYVQSCEVFDSLYLASENEQMVWYDAVHESPEMSAMTSVLLYSVLKGGAPVDGMPANWLDIPATQWATAYRSAARTQFIRQDLLTKFSVHFASVQITFNNRIVTGVGAPEHVHRFSCMYPASVTGFGGDLAGRSTLLRAAGVGILHSSTRTGLKLLP